MESISALEQLEEKISQINSYAHEYNDFMSKRRITSIEKRISEIKDTFKIDYTIPMEITEKEKQELKKIVLKFIREKKDNFNTHYIQLLAWHIHELYVLPVKKHGVLQNVTFLEYAPSSFIPITATNRIFNLFLPRRIETEKVSTALVLNYLNNYEHASPRFMSVLNSYLKRIHFSKNTDVYFNFTNVIKYIEKKTPASKLDYFERLKTMGIRENTIQTKYFINALKGY